MNYHPSSSCFFAGDGVQGLDRCVLPRAVHAVVRDGVRLLPGCVWGWGGHRDRTGAPGLGGTAMVNFGQLSNSGLKNIFSPGRDGTMES